MLDQSIAMKMSHDELKKQLYASVGLPNDDEFMFFLDNNFSPYNFILGCNPYIRNGKRGQIGNMRNICIFRYTQSNVINELCNDLDEMNYEYRILDTHFSDRSLHKKEFMLKLFICNATVEDVRGDYRIMRYDPNLGEWFFKPSACTAPMLCKDARGVIMLNDEPAGYVVKMENTREKEFYPFAYVAVRQMRFSKKLWKAFTMFVKWLKNRHQ
ncbi:MAG: hypothetical protein IJX99_09295 [Clostridia bacterium]|nr:hypothetical protein [Clostridia bacterium]